MSLDLNENLIFFWLGVSGITFKRANALLERYTPFEIWEGVGNTITRPELFGEKTYNALIRFKNVEFLNESIEKLDAMGVSFITYNNFPEKLQQREVNPPVMLYYKGDIKLLSSESIAIVGTRSCSSYGKEAATRLATDLCDYDLTIVSGLAYGIDTYAHRAVLKAGGKTIAVLGSGLNCVTPAANVSLSKEIIENGGLILTEYPPRYEATKYTFPERNRIISGLSSGVIVVEAGLQSGALITSNCALVQNRTVFAVPGNITSLKSAGTNRLLYEGAVPALTAADVCDTLGVSSRKIAKKPRVLVLDIFEQKIYNILQSGEENFDSLVFKAELPPPKLSAVLSSMEIKGIINKKQSNIYCLA